jgi:putative acetyltransferase
MPGVAVHELGIREADPQGADAIALLDLAAAEARQLYPELSQPNAPAPKNPPTPPRGVYLIAYVEDKPVAMGAHRPLDSDATEIRRMFVRQEARGLGVARKILAALEDDARKAGFAVLRLETGFRQWPAMRLYEQFGFVRIPAFGPYASDPTSVCYEKPISPSTEGGA